MSKVRMISIKRVVEETITDKTGKAKTQKVQHWYPCRVNAAVPFNHRMCQ